MPSARDNLNGEASAPQIPAGIGVHQIGRIRRKHQRGAGRTAWSVVIVAARQKPWQAVGVETGIVRAGRPDLGGDRGVAPPSDRPGGIFVYRAPRLEAGCPECKQPAAQRMADR